LVAEALERRDAVRELVGAILRGGERLVGGLPGVERAALRSARGLERGREADGRRR
jgi:hypothetical protein